MRLRLAVLWVALAATRWLAALPVSEPRIFRDELLHWELAKAFAAHRPFLFFGERIDYPAVLYPMVLSLVFHVADGARAFALAQLLNAVLVSAVIWPAYGFAREFAPPATALAVAGLSALVPGGVYSALIMQESLYYPLFVLACWLSYRVLARGDAGAALACAVALGLTYFTKPLGVLLAVAYAGAFAAWGIVALRRAGTRALLYRAVPLVVLGAALLIRHAVTKSDAPGSASEIVLSRFYVEEAHGPLVPPLLPMAGVLVALIAALALGTGMAPLATFVSGWRTRYRDHETRLFTVFTSLVVVIYGVAIARHTLLLNETPKVLERYLFAVAPLVLVGWLVALPPGHTPARTPERTPMRMSKGILAFLVLAIVLTIGPLNRLLLSRATDAPSLTLLWTARRALGNANLVALGAGVMAALVGLGVAQAQEHGWRGVAGVAILLIGLNAGWYVTMYRQHYLDAPIGVAHLLERRLEPGDRVTVVLSDTSETLQRVALYAKFWLGERMTGYWTAGEPRPWYADASGAPADAAGRTRASYLVVRDGSAACPNARPVPWSRPDASLHIAVLRVPEGGCGTS